MSGIFKPIIVQPVKHIYNMLTLPEYFTHNRLWTQLRFVQRYHDCNVKFNNWNLTIPDNLSFLYSYKEIFLDKIYNFKFESQAPRILDLGANIGLSILFFKYLYPNAKITGFEADPKIFTYLKQNIYGNGYIDVELINKAIWYENTKLSFMSEGSDAGKISSNQSNIVVEAVDIFDILSHEKFDFIKMDIESAEEFVIPRCRDLLNEVKFIFIEYHSTIGKDQCLDKILLFLKESKFRIHICSVSYTNLSPFIEIKPQTNFDLQLNIFGWKENKDNDE
jgi:FkbM family methyltransferase